jgi:medium-chain acyl-[acyl-carrier-protein] hydrolase
MKEPAFRSMPDLIDALAVAISPLLDKDYALFGHSLGALIAFELARALRRRGLRQPKRIFAAGRQAPQMPETRAATYQLPQAEFIDELARLNGTPKEVLDHPELMELMIPLLRADFELLGTYEFKSEEPLECPITVYGGFDDLDTPRDALLPWREQTTSGCDLHMFRGDHFFLRSAEQEVLARLRQQLLEMLSPSCASPDKNLPGERLIR